MTTPRLKRRQTVFSGAAGRPPGVTGDSVTIRSSGSGGLAGPADVPHDIVGAVGQGLAELPDQLVGVSLRQEISQPP